MIGFDVVVALFGLFMLVRHGPRAVALLRGQGSRSMAMVSLLNALLAVAILAVAVKGLVGRLMSR